MAPETLILKVTVPSCRLIIRCVSGFSRPVGATPDRVAALVGRAEGGGSRRRLVVLLFVVGVVTASQQRSEQHRGSYSQHIARTERFPRRVLGGAYTLYLAHARNAFL